MAVRLTHNLVFKKSLCVAYVCRMLQRFLVLPANVQIQSDHTIGISEEYISVTLRVEAELPNAAPSWLHKRHRCHQVRGQYQCRWYPGCVEG